MKKYGILLMLLAAVAVVGCGKKEEAKKPAEEAGPKKVQVVATTGMIADIVRHIGAEKVNVTTLIGPGVDPHTYKATDDDVKQMLAADVIFFNGLNLEGAMTDDFARISGKVRAVAVTDKMPEDMLLRPDNFGGEYDPHVWFDVRLWMSAVEMVRDVLIEYDRASAVIFDNNAEGYLTELSELHDYVYKLAKSVPERERFLITSHDAFNYFGRSYGFQVRGVQGVSTENEPSSADMKNLAQFIIDRKIPVIFEETSVPSKYIEEVQRDVSAKGHAVEFGETLFSDDLGNAGSYEGTYVGMITYDIDNIANALSAGKEPAMP
jgi:manganese/zinc/iron transport system substrate-binding protein